MKLNVTAWLVLLLGSTVLYADDSPFEEPVRLKAGDDWISVESPGYACPTMADVDGDGKADLVVGQFRSGNMQFFKNAADDGESPRFETGDWLAADDGRLEVPGVW